MKKRIFGLLITIVFVSFLVGCDSGIYVPKSGGESTPKNEEVDRQPSLQDIISVILGNFNYIPTMQKTLEETGAQFTKEKVTLEDIVKLITGVIKTYGNGLPGLDSTDNSYHYNNVAEIALLSTHSQADGNKGPILIIKNATLNYENGAKLVNIVLLGGTEFKEGQATGILEDIQSGMGLTNEFLYDAYYAVENSNLDKNIPLIVGGVSLGGMVAQQLAALPAMQKYYKVTDVIAIASPLVSQDLIDYNVTTVRRMVDTVDIVPKTSIEYTGNGYDSKYPGKNDAVVRTGKWDTFIGSHVLSYVDTETWAGIDVLGYETQEGYNYSFVIPKDNMTWYAAPTYEAAQEKNK